MAKKNPLCPNCLKKGVREELRTGSGFHHCDLGHEYTDLEVLEGLLKAQLKPAKAAAAEPEPPQAPPGGFVVDSTNVDRLNKILPVAATDGSSLFGAVYTLTERLRECETQAAHQVSLLEKTAPAGGDATFTAVIPEAWVQTISDVAVSGGMTLEQYMNQRIREACDNMWFC